MKRRGLFAFALLLLCAGGARAAGFATATTTDPALNNMPAVDITIPAGWRFQGVVATSPCNSLPWPAFRAYAADGLSEFRVMPVFGWRWAANPRFANNAGCLPLAGVMSAAEFLEKYVEMIPGGVHVIGPMSVDATFRSRAQKFADASNSNGAVAPAIRGHTTADVAALHIQTRNGAFVIDQRLRVQLECLERSDPSAPALMGGSCWARVDVVRAPQGRLDALLSLVDGHDLIRNTPRAAWMQAVLRRQQEAGAAAMAALRRQAAQASAMLKQQHDQFMRTMQHNHEAFMAQQEASFRSSMNAANASMNARSTFASDWVDALLDQKTVYGQGGYAKVSNAYAQTWSSKSGGQTTWFQTNDPNANPNGVLPGSWTADVKVHGNGQAY